MSSALATPSDTGPSNGDAEAKLLLGISEEWPSDGSTDFDSEAELGEHVPTCAGGAGHRHVPPPPRTAEVFNIHLSASRLSRWLGIPSDDSVPYKSVGSAGDRQKLIDQWCKPRARCKTGAGIPRCEAGKRAEPKAKTALERLLGLEEGVLRKAPDREHTMHKYMSAKPDGLLGKNGLLEIKSTLAATADFDEPVELSDATLLQAWWQLQCFPEREFVLIVYYTKHHLHLWKLHQGREKSEMALYEQCLPEFFKYRKAIENGGKVTPEMGIRVVDQDAIRATLCSYRKTHLCQLALVPKHAYKCGEGATFRWVPEWEEPRNDPRQRALIDRVAAPNAYGDGHALLDRYLRVWWLSDEKKLYEIDC